MSGFSTPAGQIAGTGTNDSAAAGKVGEYVESVLASGSAVSLVTATAKTVTIISLTAGDWDVDGVVGYITFASTSVTQIVAGLSLTTNTLDVTAGRFVGGFFPATVPGGSTAAFSTPVPPLRFSLSATTSIFLIAYTTFTSTAPTAYGIIRARRVR